MDKMVNAIQTANQAKQLSDKQAARAQAAYILEVGITCALAIGLAFFVHAGFGVILEALRLGKHGAEYSLSPNADTNSSTSNSAAASDAPHIPDRLIPLVTPPAHSKARATSTPPAKIGPQHNRPASDTVKLYYAMQLEELMQYKLSSTEQHVAALILHGETNKDIAKKLRLAESTVKKHVQKILSKTGTANRIEFNRLIKTALENK